MSRDPESIKASAIVIAGFVALTLAPASSWSAPLGFEPSEQLDQTLIGAKVTLATNGQDTWIISWLDMNDDAVYSRSADDARSWSSPAIFSPDTANGVRFAADGSGNWVAAWSSCCGAFGSDHDIMIATSSDDGLTWSAPTPISPDAGVDFLSEALLAVETDGTGRWIAMGAYEASDRLFYRSDDAGATWSVPTVVDVMAGSYTIDYALDYDGAGNWVAAWARAEDGIFETHSLDGGVTWSSALNLYTTPVRPNSISLANDGAGTWLMGFAGEPAIGDFYEEAYVARSTDAGQTWSAPEYIDANPSQSVITANRAVKLVYDTQNTSWIAFWGGDGKPFGGSHDYELLYARSTDAGATWGPQAAANAEADGDGRKGILEIDAAIDGAGTWVLAYVKADSNKATYFNFPNFGDRYVFRAASHLDCGALPRTGCKSPMQARASSLKIRSNVGGSDAFSWKWSKGDATSPADLGDPLSSSSYVLCVYDHVSALPTLVFEKDILAGPDTCGAEPCWASTADGFSYADTKRVRSSVRRLDLKTGEAQRARFSFSASGASLAPAPLPFAVQPRVLAQLVNLETNACWEAAFSSPTANDTGNFKARSDAP